VDIGRSEQLESELDAMIERCARQKDPGEESELWRACGGLVAASREVAQSRSIEHVLVRGPTERTLSSEKPSGLST
jgi:hypothetical protein